MYGNLPQMLTFSFSCIQTSQDCDHKFISSSPPFIKSRNECQWCSRRQLQFVDGNSHGNSLLDHTLHQILGIDKIELQKRSAFFILHLKEVKGLSKTAIQTVISGYEDMLHYSGL